MKFFLYADQLNPTQLKRRAPEHKFLYLATLGDHTIKFCRWSSQWRCGLASIVPSSGEHVWGGVFELTDEDLTTMDEFEQDVPLTEPSVYDYWNVAGERERMSLPAGTLAYSICQVPVILQASDLMCIDIYDKDGTIRRINSLVLDREDSKHIFQREGVIHHLMIFCR